MPNVHAVGVATSSSQNRCHVNSMLATGSFVVRTLRRSVCVGVVFCCWTFRIFTITKNFGLPMFFVRPDVKFITAFPTSRYRLPTNPCQTGTCYIDRKAQATVVSSVFPPSRSTAFNPPTTCLPSSPFTRFIFYKKRYRYKITKQRGAD